MNPGGGLNELYTGTTVIAITFAGLRFAKGGDAGGQFDKVEARELEAGVNDVIDFVVTVQDQVASVAQQAGKLAGGEATAKGFLGDLLGQCRGTGDKR